MSTVVWRRSARVAVPRFLTVLAALLSSSSGVRAAPLEGTGIEFRLASREECAALLARRDVFIRALSPFDRSVRLRVPRAVSEAEFLETIAGAARAFDAEERGRLEKALAAVKARLDPWRLPLPRPITIAKTSGEEEGGAAYCREMAVVLPERILAREPAALERLLLHELFHVLSRGDPDLRDALYAVVGFVPGVVQLDPALDRRRITNPDSPLLVHVVPIEHEGETLTVVPLLHSSSELYDEARGGNLFAYLEWGLLVLEPAPAEPAAEGASEPAPPRERWIARKTGSGEPQILAPDAAPGYHARIGRNTRYILHAEEVLADNFVLAVTAAKELRSPEIVERLEAVLRRAAVPEPKSEPDSRDSTNERL